MEAFDPNVDSRVPRTTQPRIISQLSVLENWTNEHCKRTLDLGVVAGAIRQAISKHIIRRMKSATTHQRLKIVHMDENGIPEWDSAAGLSCCRVTPSTKFEQKQTRQMFHQIVVRQPVIAQDLATILAFLNELEWLFHFIIP